MLEIIIQFGREDRVTEEALRKWRERGTVPHRYRIPFLERAKARGLRLRPEDFEFEPARGYAPKPETEAA